MRQSFVCMLMVSACSPQVADVETLPVTGPQTGVTTGAVTGTATGTTPTATGTSTGAASGDCANGGVAILGCLSHDLSSLTLDKVLDGGDGLNLPRDLEFHPTVTGELWIVNRTDHSVVIAADAGNPGMNAWKLVNNENQQHFLAEPSALAFNDDGNWASIHETDDPTQGNLTPPDFMGPTLWTGNSSIFDGGHYTHLDMLHNTPNGMGVAYEEANVFWVFDGYHGSLTRYNFAQDHNLGGTDHSDGVVNRFAQGEVAMRDDLPSHLWYDNTAELLYTNDNGNNRIVLVDPMASDRGGAYGPDYDGGTQTEMLNTPVTVLVEGAAYGISGLSGLEELGGLLYVSDHDTGFIHAFDYNGNQIDWLDTGFGAGALMGLAFDPRDGSLWMVHAGSNEVWRVSP